MMRKVREMRSQYDTPYGPLEKPWICCGSSARASRRSRCRGDTGDMQVCVSEGARTGYSVLSKEQGMTLGGKREGERIKRRGEEIQMANTVQ